MLEWSGLVHPNKIIVNRDERQRRELTGIEELSESILRRGQLQPIVVTRDLVLVAGERRLTAIRALMEQFPDRHFHIKIVYSDEVDPAELKALEFEENSKRLDLSWQDNCLAILDYHEFKKTQESGWTETATGESLGISQSEVNKRLEVATALRAGDPSIRDAPKLSTAAGIIARKNERKSAAAVAQIMSFASGKAPPPPPAEGSTPPTLEEELLTTLATSTGTGFILNEDFAFWASHYDGPKFNLIHCDFPYGVGMHKSDQGSGDAHGTYEDTPEIYWSLVDTLLNHLDAFCEPSAHLLFWFSMDYYQDTFNALSTKFTVNPFPLIWHKTDNSGILPDANRGPRRTYETAFLASRGDRKIVRAVANVVGSPIQRGRHMSEKPQAVLGHFFRMLVDEHSAVLDPTAGSGSAIRAAATAGASRYLGLEINTEFAEHADEVLAQHLEELE
jgi:hypothetical protein